MWCDLCFIFLLDVDPLDHPGSLTRTFPRDRDSTTANVKSCKKNQCIYTCTPAFSPFSTTRVTTAYFTYQSPFSLPFSPHTHYSVSHISSERDEGGRHAADTGIRIPQPADAFPTCSPPSSRQTFRLGTGNTETSLTRCVQ